MEGTLRIEFLRGSGRGGKECAGNRCNSFICTVQCCGGGIQYIAGMLLALDASQLCWDHSGNNDQEAGYHLSSRQALPTADGGGCVVAGGLWLGIRDWRATVLARVAFSLEGPQRGAVYALSVD